MSQAQISVIRATPQSEHREYAMVDDKYGVFAKFYGPNANYYLKLFTDALARGEVEPKERGK